MVIDPRMSDTALSLSEEWIPLRPTTDGALCDAIAYTIIKMGLHDLAFLHRFCVGFDEETLPAARLPVRATSAISTARRTALSRTLRGQSRSRAFLLIRSSSWPTGLLRQSPP